MPHQGPQGQQPGERRTHAGEGGRGGEQGSAPEHGQGPTNNRQEEGGRAKRGRSEAAREENQGRARQTGATGSAKAEVVVQPAVQVDEPEVAVAYAGHQLLVDEPASVCQIFLVFLHAQCDTITPEVVEVGGLGDRDNFEPEVTQRVVLRGSFMRSTQASEPLRSWRSLRPWRTAKWAFGMRSLCLSLVTVQPGFGSK